MTRTMSILSRSSALLGRHYGCFRTLDAELLLHRLARSDYRCGFGGVGVLCALRFRDQLRHSNQGDQCCRLRRSPDFPALLRAGPGARPQRPGFGGRRSAILALPPIGRASTLKWLFCASTPSQDSSFHVRSPLSFSIAFTTTDLPGVDSPVWSLSYEAAYYALFAIAIFTRGNRRIVLMAICCLIFGTAMLWLLPVWLAGVGLQRWIAAMQTRKKRFPAAGIFSFVVVVLAILAWPHFNAYGPHGGPIAQIPHGGGRAIDAGVFYLLGCGHISFPLCRCAV